MNLLFHTFMKKFCNLIRYNNYNDFRPQKFRAIKYVSRWEKIGFMCAFSYDTLASVFHCK